jgi:hypothetical protein
MKFRVKSIIVITLLILLFLLAVSMLSYVFYSRSSPYVWEIIIGSIMVSLLLGVISKFIDKLFEKPIAAKPITCLIGVSICLLVLISLLIYLSNMPKKIRAEIPVTYLVSLKTTELASGITFNDDTADFCYMEARSIFKDFKKANPDNARQIGEMFERTKPTDPDSFIFGYKCFQNLTEYLVFYYMSSPLDMAELERVGYWKQVGDWEAGDSLGRPEMRISGHPMSVECVAGDFKKNLFYGIKGRFGDKNPSLTFPKGADISLTRMEWLTSQFVIQDNKYFKITIGIRFLVNESQGITYIDESEVLPYSNSDAEGSGPFQKFNAVIYYEATFNKWRYAFPDMQYYEKWANTLLSLLQRRFAWGRPALLDYAGILRHEKRYDKGAKSSE